MINGDTEFFLDTAWFTETTLYYKGYSYWFEGYWDRTKEKPFHFSVYKYPTRVVDKIYVEPITDQNDEIPIEYIVEFDAEDEDTARKRMLESKIFEGKTFWEVENEVAWYDEI